MSDTPRLDWPSRRDPPPDWRRGAAAVAALSFDVDAETPILAVDERYATHLSTMSHQAYGPRVGIPRILELLARLEVRSTFFFPGATVERWPDALSAVLEAGHEVALHSHRHVPLVQLSPDEQRADLERGLAALAAHGVTPAGYRAPLWQQTRYTLDLLAEYGIRWDSSLMDDDRPYVIDPGAGRPALAELPVHWSLDDWEQYAFVPEPDIGQNIELPRKVLELWTGELEAMRATGSLCLICCHPFLTGRPSRLRNVERFVEFARGLGDVELLTCGEVAARVLDDPAPS
ncbi:Peptidoglycan deacetylase [Baekduia alba]|uniref:polysaccharide deacetylase family protein n=1 Tax=Baekduia alba TaxID=2997333 RepID=UPI002341F516|nr:polysaccharide deacetylase [Baekduia alba]WCB96724.1 Peptidoglycan deacetylase [Baekduia alba]